MFVKNDNTVFLAPYISLPDLDISYSHYPPELLSPTTTYVSSVDVLLRRVSLDETRGVGMTIICQDGDVYSLNGVSQSQLSMDNFEEFSFEFNTNPNEGPVCDLTKKLVIITLGNLGNVEVAGTDNNTIPWMGAGTNNLEPDDTRYAIWFNIHASPPGGKTPVLIVPGLLGTDMYSDTNQLWVNMPMMAVDVGDGFMNPLQFNNTLQPTDQSVYTGQIVSNPDKLFDYTAGLVQEFENQGYLQSTTSSDATLFTFPYDWRYGASGTIMGSTTVADLLKEKINEIRQQTGSDQVDIIAHSTGGLLVKQYVMEHPSDNHIRKAVFVGVPNLGAPKALKVLFEGDNFGIPFLSDSEMQKISQNLPVTYDLSPGQEYYDSLGSYLRIGTLDANNPSYKDLNYTDAVGYLKNQGYNSLALNNESSFHSADFDNFDMRSSGVDLYNIVGCKTGTIGRILDLQDANGNHTDYVPNPDGGFSGDGTVPFGSADSLAVNGSNTYFARYADHGKMPSADGIRQLIVNLISGSTLDTGSNIITRDQLENNHSLCEVNGESINIKSPVAIGVTDQNGNFSGMASDSSIQNDIPGADYEVWGEHKYVFLPEGDGQQYKINLNGTGSGTFTIDDQTIDQNNIVKTQVFSNLSVTPALTGTVNLGGDNGQTTLTLLATPDSSPITVSPDSVINAEESLDLTPPISTSTLTGTMGQPGYYMSNVAVALSASDPVIDGNASTTSGVLKIQYSLDGGATTTYQSTVDVKSEGDHTVSFYATDNAGNNEQPQSLTFTIDKTPPELIIQFDPNAQDLSFTAADTYPTVLATSIAATKLVKRPPVKVVDQDNVITATDAAGNTTVLTLQGKDRKHNLKADIKSLTYNGVAADLSKNTLHFDWLFNKSGVLQVLTQQVVAKNNFNLLAVFGLGKTVVIGKDQTGKISQTVNGLALLKVLTSRGDLAWSLAR